MRTGKAMKSRGSAGHSGVALFDLLSVIGILVAIANIVIKVDGAGRCRNPVAVASVTGFDWSSQGRSTS
jgi:hypothetical protein